MLDLFFEACEALEDDTTSAKRGSSHGKEKGGPSHWMLDWKDEILLTLVCMRQGFTEEHLGYLFGVSGSLVGEIFQERLEFLSGCWSFSFLVCPRWETSIDIHTDRLTKHRSTVKHQSHLIVLK
eukprot:comp24333_c3_seq1/m.46041 comp24333_c3_seq1/g.46041  ORF comp24333_c3_seq1/g.46041 comp24333_c3_seq1/m.46041 type:complete len:124 (-) comp24333_c3_seq1:591-962(-)